MSFATRPTISFEIELALTGDIEPAEAETGPTYDCGGTPGHDAFVDSVEVADLGVIELVLPPLAERASHRFVWKTTSVLDGVDRTNPEIQKLFANILALKREEAEQALLDDADERVAA